MNAFRKQAQPTVADDTYLPELESDELMADAVSFVQTSATVAEAAAGCEVCVYVLENKEQHQPYLCRGLKTPDQQQSVRDSFRLL